MYVTRVQLSASGVDTVFIGDSITQADSATFDSIPGELSWVRYVVTARETPWRFRTNVAIGGQTLADMAARFDRDVPSFRSDAVMIMGGTNDAILDVPLDLSLGSLRDMVTSAEAAGLEVWVVSPPPLDFTEASETRLATLVLEQERLATSLGAHFLSLNDEISERQWVDGLSLEGVHPSVAGAREIARIIMTKGRA